MSSSSIYKIFKDLPASMSYNIFFASNKSVDYFIIHIETILDVNNYIILTSLYLIDTCRCQILVLLVHINPNQ